MTNRLALAITVAFLFGGMLYFALSDSNTTDAQSQGLVCATPTPTPTPTGEVPTPTPMPVGSFPAFPMSFSGSATVAGNPIPDCTFLFARIGTAVSRLVPIIDGKFNGLAVGALEPPRADDLVTFHLSDDLIAAETHEYIYTQQPPNSPAQMFKRGLVLTFPHLVTPSPTAVLAEDTPVPTAPPTATPVIRATVPPVAVQPTSTPTPSIAHPAIYSGPLTIAGLESIPPGAVLTARIGSAYESLPAAIVGQTYQNLVIAPGSASFIGQPIEFFLNGFKSVSLDEYRSGARETAFEIIFIGYPTPTPELTLAPPTNTPVPTPTPVPPTNTPEPTPTATPTPTPTPTATLRPTRTPIPTLALTNTPEPTAVPPTPRIIERVVTATPEPADTPTPEPEPEGGLCSSTGPVPLSAGIGSLMMLFAPVGLLYGARQVRRNRRRP